MFYRTKYMSIPKDYAFKVTDLEVYNKNGLAKQNLLAYEMYWPES